MKASKSRLFYRLFLFEMIVLFFTGYASGHDTTHIHPLITDKIADLIGSVDIDKAYGDLYLSDPNPDLGRVYWGKDHDLDEGVILNQSYLISDQLNDYSIYNNVIDGVVQEDAPALKVIDHFYHAKDGIGLTAPFIPANLPSSQRAMMFFNEAVDRMSGYHEESVKTAFFEFGQSLHHVEDMSSPAHIHNDPHLTFADEEKDDYEGWYLPQMKQDQYFGARLEGSPSGINTNLFANAVVVRVINDPWVDIWGSSNINSMVNYFYDRTTFRGTLQFPFDTIDQIELDLTDNIEVVTAAIPPLAATGELQEMFPCPGGDLNDPNCLHWQEDDLMDLAHWEINAVGAFRHQYSPYLNPNDWWAIELETDPNSGNVINSVPTYLGVFYIEQLARDNENSNPIGTPVVPVAMRGNFNSVWVEGTNDMAANSKQLLQIYAENLLGSAAEFGAGFTQYWYDVANTPPYLKSVNASQAEIVYSGFWDDDGLFSDTDPYVDLENCILSATVCNILERSYIAVLSRSLKFDTQNIKHISDNQNLTLEFIFNEPMKEISLLRIGAYDGAGVCIEADSSCVELVSPVVARSSDEKTLTLTLLPAQLAGLNGKLQMTVKALDKNNHRNGTDCAGRDDRLPSNAGGELDSTPETPARRNISFAETSLGTSNPVNCYPWYQTDGVAETLEDDAYSYDFANGDQNHWLVFDTGSPTATVTVDTVLP